MRLVAVSNKVTFRVPTFVAFFLVVSGHRRVELVERASPVSFAAAPVPSRVWIGLFRGASASISRQCCTFYVPHCFLRSFAFSSCRSARLWFYPALLSLDPCLPRIPQIPARVQVRTSTKCDPVFYLYE